MSPKLVRTLVLGTLALCLVLPTAGHAQGHGGGSDNHGSVKISQSGLYEPPTGHSNDPHVSCPFYVQGYDLVTSTGTYTVTVQEPVTGSQIAGATVVAAPYSAVAEGDGYFFTSAALGAGDGVLSGGHYRVDVQDSGGHTKSKVFWTDVCLSAEDAPATATPAATDSASATPSATATEQPTTTATASETPTDEPSATLGPTTSEDAPTATATPTGTGTPMGTPTDTGTDAPTLAPSSTPTSLPAHTATPVASPTREPTEEAPRAARTATEAPATPTVGPEPTVHHAPRSGPHRPLGARATATPTATPVPQRHAASPLLDCGHTCPQSSSAHRAHAAGPRHGGHAGAHRPAPTPAQQDDLPASIPPHDRHWQAVPLPTQTPVPHPDWGYGRG